jgi:hypothetical protein
VRPPLIKGQSEEEKKGKSDSERDRERETAGLSLDPRGGVIERRGFNLR